MRIECLDTQHHYFFGAYWMGWRHWGVFSKPKGTRSRPLLVNEYRGKFAHERAHGTAGRKERESRRIAMKNIKPVRVPPSSMVERILERNDRPTWVVPVGRDDLTKSLTHSRRAPTTPAPTSRRRSEA